MNKYPKIGDYVIVKLLGKGGMSRVYLAVDNKLEREVAIKILLSALIEDENVKKRFLREAKTAASLRHSNIVSIYDIGETEDENYYFVMEYLSGGSLKEKIKKGKLSPSEALWIVKEIAKALEYAHNRGFVHRDIKPANIMFREDGVPVLADFGIAKAVNTATKLTQTGVSVGTPYYMSPEQIEGKEITGKSDIYSLGIVLYEALTGKVPYDAETTIAIIMKHLKDPIPKLKDVDGVKENSKEFIILQTLVNRMMEKNPEERFSAKDVINFIEKNEALFKGEKPDETTIEKITTNIEKKDFFKKPQKSKKKTFFIFLPAIVALTLILIILTKKTDNNIKTKTPSPEKKFQKTTKNIKSNTQKTTPAPSNENILKEKQENTSTTYSNKNQPIKREKTEVVQEAEKESINIEKNKKPERESQKKPAPLPDEFSKKLENINSLYRGGQFSQFVDMIIDVLHKNPDKRRIIGKILRDSLKDKKFRDFIARNSEYALKIKRNFPLIKLPPPKTIQKLPAKKSLKKLIKPEFNIVNLPQKFENIFIANNYTFLVKKKKLYNLNTKKYYSIDSKINLPVKKCGANYFFTTEFGKIYIITDGVPKRIFKAKWDIEHPPTVKNEKVFVPSLDKNIYCFSCAGKLIWKYKSDWEIATNIAVDNSGQLYYIKKGGYLVSLSMTGKISSETKLNINSPIKLLYDNGFLIFTKKHELFYLDKNYNVLKKISNVLDVKEIQGFFAIFLPEHVVLLKNGKAIKKFPCRLCFDALATKTKFILVGTKKVFVFDKNSKTFITSFPYNINRNFSYAVKEDKLFILSEKKLIEIYFKETNL